MTILRPLAGTVKRKVEGRESRIEGQRVVSSVSGPGPWTPWLNLISGRVLIGQRYFHTPRPSYNDE